MKKFIRINKHLSTPFQVFPTGSIFESYEQLRSTKDREIYCVILDGDVEINSEDYEYADGDYYIFRAFTQEYIDKYNENESIFKILSKYKKL